MELGFRRARRLDEPGLGGGLDGDSGNPGVSSDVAGIFNICGALKDTAWMETGVSIVSACMGQTTAQYPYGTGDVSLLGFPITEVDGSSILHATHTDLSRKRSA